MPELTRLDKPRKPDKASEAEPQALMAMVARGDEAAFEKLYDLIIAPVFGVVRRVVRDPAQSEEVTQEVMVQVWRDAADYNPERGGVRAWVLTIAHRRAVDRVRSVQAATAREERVAASSTTAPFDQVAEEVAGNLERQQVRRCLKSLTELQRESVLMAYYQGHSYPEVATLLGTPLGTIKTRMRDGLIRLRDCLGVTG